MGLLSLSSANGLLFGLDLPDITNFVWALGPAGLALILIAVAERIIVPKRLLVTSTLKATLARNYQYCWFASYAFLAIFVGLWSYLLLAGRSESHGFVFGEIIRVPASYTVTADRAGEVFIQENSVDSGYTRRIVWVSAGTLRTIHLTFVRRGTKEKGEADTTYFATISLDDEQMERARNRQLVLHFQKEHDDKPNRIVDEASRREYALPIYTADAASRTLPRRRFSLIASAVAQESGPSLPTVRDALGSPSQAVRRDAVADLARMLSREDARRWANAILDDAEADPNVRLSVMGALRAAVADARNAQAAAYFAVPSRQPALDFLDHAAFIHIVRDGYNPRSALGSTARNLLRTVYDRRAHAAFRSVREAAGSDNERACVAYFEIATYYNWLVSLALDLEKVAPARPHASFRSFVVGKPLLDDLFALDGWMEDARRATAGTSFAVNALREHFGEGVAYATLALSPDIRFSTAAAADPAYNRDALLRRALAAFARFEAEAASVPGFAERYRYPWHLGVARAFRQRPTLASLKASEHGNPAMVVDRNCHAVQ
jgi:hypothetical protein